MARKSSRARSRSSKRRSNKQKRSRKRRASTPSPQEKAGRTGLPNAGTATDEGKQLKHWEKIAGLADDE